jgi:hypothetical protein
MPNIKFGIGMLITGFALGYLVCRAATLAGVVL